MASQITDHVARALARMPLQFRGKPKIQSLIESFVEPLQELESVFFDILIQRAIDTATGVHLHRLGKILGQPYGGEDEELYRRYLRARVKVNRSSGTIPELIQITRLIIGNDPAARVVAEPQYPATIVIRIENMVIGADLAALLFAFLVDAVAGGVRLIVESSGVLAASTFSFANGPGLGFGAGAFARARAN